MNWNEIEELAYYIKGNADDIAELGRNKGIDFVRNKLNQIKQEIIEMEMTLAGGNEDETL